MAESCPDGLDAIRDAFNLPDPTPQLLELIRAHPELPTIGDIVVFYLELVQQSPSQIEVLSSTLKARQSLPSPPLTDLANQYR